jgi:hypothetical protein
MKKIAIKNSAVSNYWSEFYVVNGHCSLCGNRGILYTTVGATTPNGKDVGRKNFCICPNGQSLRKDAIDKSDNRQVTP